MKPFAVVPELIDSEPRSTKVKVCYHERDAAERLGCSAEVTVYIDRTGLELRQVGDVAVREAEGYLRRILERD